MADPFARMHQRLAARLGREALLRGTDACRVDVTKGVAVTGEYGQVVGLKTVIEILTPGMNAKAGDSISVGAENHTLDALFKDDGYSSRWIVR